VTLTTAPCGVPLILGQAALPASRRLRLAELGLRPGAVVTVLRVTAGGGRILGVGDARVALGRGVLSSVPARLAQPVDIAGPDRPRASAVPDGAAE
jgi:Fe2+ transport system protein FeoA